MTRPTGRFVTRLPANCLASFHVKTRGHDRRHDLNFGGADMHDVGERRSNSLAERDDIVIGSQRRQIQPRRGLVLLATPAAHARR